MTGVKITQSQDDIADHIFEVGNQARDLELKIRELQDKKEGLDHLKDVLLHDLVKRNIWD